MTIYDRVAMPATPEDLVAMLRWAHRRGRTAEAMRHPAPPRTLAVSCEEHDPTPVPDCLACVEASSYCLHGHLLMHPGTDPNAACWRPPYRDEAPKVRP